MRGGECGCRRVKEEECSGFLICPARAPFFSFRLFRSSDLLVCLLQDFVLSPLYDLSHIKHSMKLVASI